MAKRKPRKKHNPQTVHNADISGDNPKASSAPKGGQIGSTPDNDPAAFLNARGPL
ncbi:MAG TPA: hypothetical protein VJM32_03710 [Candidatus Saccharimonadales bacterium]|nr:hypothetical protein [Candidatus Saccharimonadales bacterium]